MKKKPWWRFFVILPESERELEGVYKGNLYAMVVVGAIAAVFLHRLWTASSVLEAVQNGFIFLAAIVLLAPLMEDNLLSSIEYRLRRKN